MKEQTKLHIAFQRCILSRTSPEENFFRTANNICRHGKKRDEYVLAYENVRMCVSITSH